MTSDLKEFLDKYKPETIANLMRWKKYNHIKEEIISLTTFLDKNAKMGERIFCIKKGIETLILCDCGKPSKFKTFGEGYSEFCSRKCRYDSQSGKIQNTMKKRYGVSHALQHKDFLDKSKQTTIYF